MFIRFLFLLATMTGGWILPVHPTSGGQLAISREPPIVDLRPHQHYPSGIRVRSPYLGISFVIPPDWRGMLPARSQVFLLESPVQPGIGVVLLLDDTGPEEMVARLSEPQAFEEAYILHPTGPIKQEGTRMSASYLSGENIGRAAAVLGPDRKAIMYLLAGPKDEAETYQRLIDQLAASTQFLSGETVSLLKEWYGRLSGMMLTRQWTQPDRTGESTTTSQVWHLCYDGRFVYSLSLGPSTTGPPDAGREQDREVGSWRVEANNASALLVLTTSFGTSRSYSLKYDGEQTYLDGEPVIRAASDQCP